MKVSKTTRTTKFTKKNVRGILQNPCIAVQLKSRPLAGLRRELQDALKRSGIAAEYTDSTLHVSIAYANGSAGVFDVRRVLGEIQKLDSDQAFRAQACGFKILPGLSTPYDYISIEIEPSLWLRRAGAIARRHLKIRRFHGGFRSHISLLKVPKGALNRGAVQHLERELNASFLAARALGSTPQWSGKCVAASEQPRYLARHLIRCKRPLRAA